MKETVVSLRNELLEYIRFLHEHKQEPSSDKIEVLLYEYLDDLTEKYLDIMNKHRDRERSNSSGASGWFRRRFFCENSSCIKGSLF